MKPVYICDYCQFTGSAENVKEHEKICSKNYGLKACPSCDHVRLVSVKDDKLVYGCKAGKEIPEGCHFKNCDLHKIPSKDDVKNFLRNLLDI